MCQQVTQTLKELPGFNSQSPPDGCLTVGVVAAAWPRAQPPMAQRPLQWSVRASHPQPSVQPASHHPAGLQLCRTRRSLEGVGAPTWRRVRTHVQRASGGKAFKPRMWLPHHNAAFVEDSTASQPARGSNAPGVAAPPELPIASCRSRHLQSTHSLLVCALPIPCCTLP